MCHRLKCQKSEIVALPAMQPSPDLFSQFRSIMESIINE